MTSEQYEQFAVLTKAQFPDWETVPDEPIALWWSGLSGQRIPRDQAPLNWRTLVTLFGLRGNVMLDIISSAGDSNSLYRRLSHTLENPDAEAMGIDLAHSAVWAMAQAMFPGLGITTEEMALLDHWRTRDATRAEVAGFGVVYEYDVTRALRGGA